MFQVRVAGNHYPLRLSNRPPIAYIIFTVSRVLFHFFQEMPLCDQESLHDTISNGRVLMLCPIMYPTRRVEASVLSRHRAW